MESRAIQVYNPSMTSLNRSRSAVSMAQMSELQRLLQEFFAELENFCPVQGVIPAPAQRSPLPVWYLRRPLQDITGFVNSPHGVSADILKKNDWKKKKQASWNMEKENKWDMQKNPRKQNAYSNTAVSVTSRGSQLRKGFR